MTEAARRLTTVTVPVGRTVLVDDTGGDRPVLVWHHETPHTGAFYEPLLSAAREAGVRLVAVTRPGFGGADPLPGRSVADAAADVAHVLDRLDVPRCATIGGSGGGPHALALAALDPDRVAAVAVLASPAPFADTPAWWDGMADDGGLRSAHTGGREARLAHAAEAAFDPSSFTDADWAVLDGPWAALGADAQAAGAGGPDGEVDDDVAFVTPWGVDLADVRCPVRVVQGTDDRVVPAAHGRLIVDALTDGRAAGLADGRAAGLTDGLAAGLADVEFDLRAGAGHLSVLEAVPGAMRWLRAHLPA